MSRILLVDDSPHAQRLGERILSEEGFEVVTVSNADSALIRIEDVDPDVVLADTVMPGRTGYEICQYLKMSPRHRHVRVILTAGVLEMADEERVRAVEADGFLKKPFEASALLSTVKPLAERAEKDRLDFQASKQAGKAASPAVKPPVVPFVAVVDAEQVRAAVTVALDASMDAMVDEIARRVVAVLSAGKPAAEPKPEAAAAPAPAAPVIPGMTVTRRPAFAPLPPRTQEPPPAAPAAAPPAAPPQEPVRRVSPVRPRAGSILGLDLSYHESEAPASPAPEPPAAE